MKRLSLLNKMEFIEKASSDEAAVKLFDGIHWTHCSFNDLRQNVLLVSAFIQNLRSDGRGAVGFYVEPFLGLPALVGGAVMSSCPFIFLTDEKFSSPKFCNLLNKLGVRWILSDHLLHHENLQVLGTEFTLCGTVLHVYKNPGASLCREENYLYGITTSGSTGEPKVVRVPEASLLPNIIDFSAQMKLTSNDVILLSSALTFDPSMVELFLAIHNQATLVLVSKGIKGCPKMIHKAIVEGEVTFYQTTPSLFRLWSADLKRRLLSEESSMRVLVLGGEPFPNRTELKTWDPGPKIKIFNAYGITEVSCWAFLKLVWPDPDDFPIVRLNFKEAEAALRSVFSQREVARFVSLTQSRKRKKLQELIRLVTGVRIYNRAKMNPKSSDASYADEISGLPELLFNATITMKERVEESMKRMTLQVTNLERALEECFTWDRKSVGVLNFNSFITDEEVDAAKDVLCLYHQVVQVLTFMLENLHETVQLHLNTEANMRSTVSQMMTKLDCKVGIPRTEVEKDFVELYHNWKFFQGRFVLISEFNRMLKKYNQLSEVPFLPESIAWVLSSPNLFSPSQEEAELNNEYSNNFEISWAEDEGGKVEFAGFDPVWLILTNGILLTGKRKMGLLKFDEKCYAFRDHESAKLFCLSPVECIERVYDFGRRHPAFIDILQLRRGLKENRKFHGVQTRFHSSKSVQCDVHPIATRLVYKYRHSTWSMKQDACQAADLKNKKTLAMQTTLSHMRRSVDTQTYSAVEKESLTSKSEGTSVPKLQNFIYGLRGRREEVQHTVNLTRPIQEGHSKKRPCDALYSDDGNLESGCCRLDCANNGRYKTKMTPCVKFENNNFKCSQRELKIEGWSR